ncbi:MAG TPA: hypothetical protein VIG30_16070, partial [Ktedonobacterales bacterium]
MDRQRTVMRLMRVGEGERSERGGQPILITDFHRMATRRRCLSLAGFCLACRGNPDWARRCR